MTKVFSFPPISSPSARLLILGSMPGVASLQANQYYAHPRNAFWPMMQQIVGFDADADYATKTKALQQAGIAVWDVLQQCEREGSLDSAIKTGSRQPNPFPDFFAKHPNIHHILFNGAEAARSFKRYVLPNIDANAIQMTQLPSTSPAHTLPFAEKLAAWELAIKSAVK